MAKVAKRIIKWEFKPIELKEKVMDPNGAVSFGLGTLGGTIGAGIFLEQMRNSINEGSTSQTVTTTVSTTQVSPQGVTTVTSTATTTNPVADLSTSVAVGTSIGASSAVFGGIIAAVVIKRMFGDNKQPMNAPRILGVMAISIGLGAISGAGMGWVIESFEPNLGPIGIWVGVCVGGVAGLIDSMVF